MTNYVIFGPGRVGANMASYLKQLGHKADLISRRQAEAERTNCIDLIEKADIVAAALPDDKLQSWFEAWRAEIGARTAIHFSGAVSVEGAHAFHPLYSFPKALLPISVMKEIAFACPQNGPSFKDIFPGAPNPNFKITEENRARYHALAVLSGNFAAYLWNETAKEFSDFVAAAPEAILKSYFAGVVERFAENPTDSLTGPVARKDKITIEKNLSSLNGNKKLQNLYKAFLAAAWPDHDINNDD